MESQGIFSKTVGMLEQALDLRSEKHNVTVSNIANIDTPNYKAFDVLVEKEMAKRMGEARTVELQQTRPGHFPGKNASEKVEPQRINSPQTGTRGDGNTVDLDKAMGDLTENTLLYSTFAQIINKKFQGLKNVIHEGK